MENPTSSLVFSVSDFVAVLNQTLEFAYPSIAIEGEVAEFRISQGKWVFFKLKDAEATIDCFMVVQQLRIPIQDGMKVVVTAISKLTKWGKFSLTIRSIRPKGEGDIKKSFEILKTKLEAEGLFAAERKRSLPLIPSRIAIISSTQAAGYIDFVKILNDRWVGVKAEVADVQVQGNDAPDQIIRAISYFNQQEDLAEVLVIVRGGGSADDLSTFNDEPLVRAIAASRIPTLVGVGHEVDETLADLVADVRAATPSNAAQIIVPDRRERLMVVNNQVAGLVPVISQLIDQQMTTTKNYLNEALALVDRHISDQESQLGQLRQVLAQLNPSRILARGYAILRGPAKVGSDIEIETYRQIIKAEVKNVVNK